MKRLWLLCIILVIAAAAWWFYMNAQHQSGYGGLPAVACIDPTLSIQQDFTLTIRIQVNGQPVALDPTIGHDPGKCLRIIHTDDASGKVIVQSNDPSAQYTLAEFFNVWHKQFGGNEFLGNPVNSAHGLTISVNGQPVSNQNVTLLSGQTITIVYQ